MGLDSYIFKTTKQGAMAKKKEILNAKDKDLQQGINFGDHTIFIYPRGEGRNNHIECLNPDVYWIKYNHITAWVSEKVFGNTGGTMGKYIGVLTKQDLLALREDCRKVIEHCVLPNGELNIDEAYCKEIFPSLDIEYSGSPLYDQYFIEEILIAKTDIDRLLFTSNQPNIRFIFFAYF